MKMTSIINEEIKDKVINRNSEINIIRNDLLKMRFLKVKSEGFSSSEYKKKRKSLARLLTIIKFESK